MKPQHLTVKKVKKAAFAAFKARKLTAQHRDPAKRECHYEVGAYRCAIGAAMNKKTIERLHMDGVNDDSIESLVAGGYVTCDDVKAIADIQEAHDEYAHQSQQWYLSQDVRPYRDAFLELIKA